MRQRGAVFVTLHISSTGLPGTAARVTLNSDLLCRLRKSNGVDSLGTHAQGAVFWD